MDESHAPQDFETWIHDAREGGLPVVCTGVVLFRVELGVPFWATALMLGLLMLTVLVIAARVTFGPREPGEAAW